MNDHEVRNPSPSPSPPPFPESDTAAVAVDSSIALDIMDAPTRDGGSAYREEQSQDDKDMI